MDRKKEKIMAKRAICADETYSEKAHSGIKEYGEKKKMKQYEETMKAETNLGRTALSTSLTTLFLNERRYLNR